MINAENELDVRRRLQIRRNKDFILWYMRWFDKQDFGKQIHIANCKGYKELKIDLYDTKGFNIQRFTEYEETFKNQIIEDFWVYDITFEKGEKVYYIDKLYTPALYDGTYNMKISWEVK